TTTVSTCGTPACSWSTKAELSGLIPATSYHYQVCVRDNHGPSGLPACNGPSGSASYQEFTTTLTAPPYGSAYQMDSLHNAQIGGPACHCPDVQVGFYFRADTTAPLDSIRVYIMNHTRPGYGGGDGGSLRISVQSDASGHPSGVQLAHVNIPKGQIENLLQTY